jgi:hypothetical protein
MVTAAKALVPHEDHERMGASGMSARIDERPRSLQFKSLRQDWRQMSARTELERL